MVVLSVNSKKWLNYFVFSSTHLIIKTYCPNSLCISEFTRSDMRMMLSTAQCINKGGREGNRDYFIFEINSWEKSKRAAAKIPLPILDLVNISVDQRPSNYYTPKGMKTEYILLYWTMCTWQVYIIQLTLWY